MCRSCPSPRQVRDRFGEWMDWLPCTDHCFGVSEHWASDHGGFPILLGPLSNILMSVSFSFHSRMFFKFLPLFSQGCYELFYQNVSILQSSKPCADRNMLTMGCTQTCNRSKKLPGVSVSKRLQHFCFLYMLLFETSMIMYDIYIHIHTYIYFDSVFRRTALTNMSLRFIADKNHPNSVLWTNYFNTKKSKIRESTRIRRIWKDLEG